MIMNNFYPEHLLEIAKQRTQREIVASQLAQKTRQVSSSKLWLGTLGTWMVVSGEKLQALNAESSRTNQLGFSQNKAKKARA
jgi:hypothetical protein